MKQELIMKIGSKVKIVDSTLFDKFNILPKTIGKVTRLNGDRATVEFIQNEQRTTINVFVNQIKVVK